MPGSLEVVIGLLAAIVAAEAYSFAQSNNSVESHDEGVDIAAPDDLRDGSQSAPRFSPPNFQGSTDLLHRLWC